MPLTVGTRLGPYEVVSPLGAGGMGEVYRARDSRLGRDVAVKVLPQHLTASAEVRARFEREAKTVSSLNHPHICTLFDVGREGDTDFLVMELVEGETLAQRLANGALPTAEVLRLGSQIADALDRAHRAGVIHRDLKPGNVMLTKSGAKLMDFGLARATGLAGPAESGATLPMLSQSPTVAAPLTAEGTIIGTFQYMAPEQLEGREADARSDLWALGCVLYEMATGRRAFEGRSQASLISAIMEREPAPISTLAPMSPAGLERLVGALLAKHPDERIQTAHDAKLQLQWAGEGASGSAGLSGAHGTPGAAGRGRGSPVPWIVAGVAVMVALGLAAMLVLPRDRGPGPVQSAIVPPPGADFSSTNSTPVPLAISPDGSRLAFCAHLGGGPDRLWVRTLATGEARPLAGTEGAQSPFFSPDGRSIAFFSAGKLRRIAVGGGPVIVIADAPDPRGGSWGSRGIIVFAARGAAGLSQVKEDGGTVTPATALDTTLNEATHRHPHFLPDGVHFLYLARRAGAGKGEEPMIYAGSTDAQGRTPVIGVASNVAYASGHLLYVAQGNLVAHVFDPGRRKLRGSAIPISDSVRMDERFSRGTFAVSQNGVLAFMTGQDQALSRLQWVDRRGRSLGDVGEPGLYTFGGAPQLDPTGRRTAVAMLNAERGVSDIWIVDLETGRRRRLSVDDEDHYSCIWSPDGRRVFMNTLLRSGGSALVSLHADGTGAPQTVWTSPGYILPRSVSSDGRWIVMENQDLKGSYDVIALPLAGGGAPVPVAAGPAIQGSGALSPDGRFVMYTSDESGRDEVYVTTFPPPGGRWQASAAGGRGPRWSRDGREVYFIDPENFVTALPVTLSGGGMEFGSPQRLFQIYGVYGSVNRFDVAPDGRRFLITSDVGQGMARPVTLITEWTSALKR